MSATIAPTAIIEEGAQIGDNVTIGDYCKISSKTVIGDGTTLALGVHTIGKVTIGKNNTVFSYSVLGSPPQSLSYQGEEVELIIGNDNMFHEFTMFSAGSPQFGGKTIIGDNNFLMAYVHIGHDCRVGNNNIFANAATLAGHVEVGNNVNIGGMTPVHQFVKIGDFCMIGGASAISQDIPHYCMAQGNHAKLRGLNRHALRKNMERDDINAIYHAYKTVFSGDMPYKEKTQQHLKNDSNPYVQKFCRFILDSKRGIPFSRKHNDN